MYIDSHCHLDFACFKGQLDDLLKRCQALGIEQFLLPSTTADSWSDIIALNQHYQCFRIALGLHPYFLGSVKSEHIAMLNDTLARNDVVAVGEIGLDKWPNMPDYTLQQSVLIEQLKLAKQYRLPVILHARKSEDDLLKLLREQQFTQGGIVHAFNGSAEQAKRFIDYGFVLGIGGTVTYPRARKAQRVLQGLSDEDFVLETDSPDMPVCGYQGQMNTPERLLLIAQAVATLRGQSLEDIAHQTSENLFRVLPKWHKV